MWEVLGHSESIHKELWPVFDESKLNRNLIEIPVQVNGKVKLVVKVEKESSEETLKEIIHNDPAIQKILETNNIVKEIYVPKRIYNIVTKAK
jgi:leucyl-tRNA synthetase